MQDDGGEQTCETSPDRSDKMVKVTSGSVGIPQQMLDNSRQECWSVKGTLFYFHQLLDLAPVIGRIMVASGAHVPDSLHGKEIWLKTMADLGLLSPTVQMRTLCSAFIYLSRDTGFKLPQCLVHSWSKWYNSSDDKHLPTCLLSFPEAPSIYWCPCVLVTWDLCNSLQLDFKKKEYRW